MMKGKCQWSDAAEGTPGRDEDASPANAAAISDPNSADSIGRLATSSSALTNHTMSCPDKSYYCIMCLNLNCLAISILAVSCYTQQCLWQCLWCTQGHHSLSSPLFRKEAAAKKTPTLANDVKVDIPTYENIYIYIYLDIYIYIYTYIYIYCNTVFMSTWCQNVFQDKYNLPNDLRPLNKKNINWICRDLLSAVQVTSFPVHSRPNFA